ncbi:hypothetical protein HZF02_15010 [Pseudomonas yamanorum]|nr:hypothetical protein HZF02_15010 [Pseudomonas yamanorum]
MKIIHFTLMSLFSLSANAQTISMAEKLTALSLDKAVNHSSPEVKRTQAALTRGLTVCNIEKEEKLANIAWSITEKIRAEGQHAETTDIIEGLNAVLSGARAKQNCTELLSLYAANRILGSTHSDAVMGARRMYRSTGVVD